MRVGYNPNKDKAIENTSFNHQVIVPVHIPYLKQYFRDSLDILKISLNSLYKTCHSGTFITVINNGSCQEVTTFLEDSFKRAKIQELVHTENIGKMNSVVKGLAGHNTPLVTITDCDVLFLTNWQKETYSILKAFPKVGVIGLTPQFKSYENCSGNVLFENIFNSRMRFRNVRNPEALKMYYESLGWNDEYNKDYLKKILTLQMNGCEAVIGSGHYVATYRRDVFNGFESFFDEKMGGNSEKALDFLPLKKNFWRLTTADNYAFHMGNVTESWMWEQLKDLCKSEEDVYVFKSQSRKDSSGLIFFLKNRLFVKIYSIKFFRNFFYSITGLPKIMKENY